MPTSTSSATETPLSKPDVAQPQTSLQPQQSKTDSRPDVTSAVLTKEPGYPSPSAIREQTSVKKPEKKPSANNIISWVLQGGVILSAVVIMLGLLLLPTQPGGLSVHR